MHLLNIFQKYSWIVKSVRVTKWSHLLSIFLPEASHVVSLASGDKLNSMSVQFGECENLVKKNKIIKVKNHSYPFSCGMKNHPFFEAIRSF